MVEKEKNHRLMNSIYHFYDINCSKICIFIFLVHLFSQDWVTASLWGLSRFYLIHFILVLHNSSYLSQDTFFVLI